jgi:hypothetical protein
MVAAMHDVIAHATAGCVQVDHAMLARRHALCGAGRRDTMIASMSLLMLLAGWVVDFADLKYIAWRRIDDEAHEFNGVRSTAPEGPAMIQTARHSRNSP